MRWLLSVTFIALACCGSDDKELTTFDASVSVGPDASTPLDAQAPFLPPQQQQADAATAVDAGFKGRSSARSDETLLYEGPPEPYLRVEILKGADGSLQIERVESLSTVRPVQPVGGEYVVRTVAASGVITAVPVSMRARFNAHARSGKRVEPTWVDLASSDALIPDSPDLLRVELTSPEGSVIASFEAARIEQASAEKGIPPGQFTSHHPHVSTRRLPLRDLQEVVEGGTPVGLTPDLLEIFDEGLLRSAPAARLSVRRVLAANFPDLPEAEVNPSEYVLFTLGSTIVINANWEALDTKRFMIESVVHEAAHSFTFLVEPVHEGVNERWPAEILAKAQSVIDTHHLSTGLSGYVLEMHTDYARRKRALPYASDPTSAEAPPQGFASNYGATNVWEDIAEHVALVQYDPLSAEVCRFLGSQPDHQLTALNALAYTKLLLLTHVGLIDRKKFEVCVNGLSAQATRNGIMLAPSTGFIDTTSGGWATVFSNIYLAVNARNGKYRGSLQIRDPDFRPLGVHRLGTAHPENADTDESVFALAHDESYNLFRISRRGLAFVTSATNEEIEGIILLMSLQNAVGTPLDEFDVSTFRYKKE